MGIPITLVSGFLGSGKTSLINQVLKTSQNVKEIAVIENEVGDVGVDHKLIFESVEEIYQLNQGCICCNLRSDLLAILKNIRDMYQTGMWNLKHIIIETTGIADPRPIVQTIQLMAGNDHFFFVDSVYTVVDAINYKDSLTKFEEVSQQIVFADRIYLSKLGQEDVSVIKADLSHLNPFAQVIPFDLDVPIESHQFFNQGLYNKVFEPEELQAMLQAEESNYDHDHHHHHEEGHNHGHHHDHHGIETIYLETSLPLDGNQVQYFIDWLMMSQQDRLYRYKGFIKLTNQDHAYLLQGVSMNYQFAPVVNNDKMKTQLVLIGKEMDEKLITDAFSDLKSLSM